MLNIITGASSNHYKSARQFLKSCPEHARVYFWDLGLTQHEKINLQVDFPTLRYRRCPFEDLPDHAQLQAPCAGAYAWKPWIIAQMYDEVDDGIMVWCDAGNVITEAGELIDVTYRYGIYTPFSCHAIERWTHPDTIKAMKAEKFIQYPMRNAAIVSVVCNDKMIRKFLQEWKDWAMKKEVVIPEGSTRADHRWDQSILSCLFYIWDVRATGRMIGVKIHQDCDDKE